MHHYNTISLKVNQKTEIIKEMRIYFLCRHFESKRFKLFWFVWEEMFHCLLAFMNT